MNLWKSTSTLWSVACQALMSVGFPRQEYWGGLPFLSPGDLPDPGIELVSLALAGGFFTTCTAWEALCFLSHRLISEVFSDSKKDD